MGTLFSNRKKNIKAVSVSNYPKKYNVEKYKIILMDLKEFLKEEREVKLRKYLKEKNNNRTFRDGFISTLVERNILSIKYLPVRNHNRGIVYGRRVMYKWIAKDVDIDKLASDLFNEYKKRKIVKGAEFVFEKTFTNKGINGGSLDTVLADAVAYREEKIMQMAGVYDAMKGEGQDEMLKSGNIIYKNGISLKVIDSNDIVFCINENDKTEKVLPLSKSQLIDNGFKIRKKPLKLTIEQIKERLGIEGDLEVL